MAIRTGTRQAAGNPSGYLVRRPAAAATQCTEEKDLCESHAEVSILQAHIDPGPTPNGLRSPNFADRHLVAALGRMDRPRRGPRGPRGAHVGEEPLGRGPRGPRQEAQAAGEGAVHRAGDVLGRPKKQRAR